MNGSKIYLRRTSVGEFANAIRQQAQSVLRITFQRETEKEMDPLIELIACLLEDGAGGIALPTETPVTTEQWFAWNRMVTTGPKALTRMITRELERERPPLSVKPEAMRAWAALLLRSTLDRLGML